MKVIVNALIDDVEVMKKILELLDLWETRNHESPLGKILLNYILENELHLEQLTFAFDLKYSEADNHYNNRYEDDCSKLFADELCL